MKYKPEYSRQVYHLCLLGCIDKELAGFFEISIRTLNNWKKLYPDFWRGMCRGKTIADAEVANALYHLACGYEYTEEKIWVFHDANGQQTIHRMQVTKHLPPNVLAIKFWLTNRAPHLWSHNPKQISVRSDAVYIRRELASGEIVVEDQQAYTDRFNQNVNAFLQHRQQHESTDSAVIQL